MIDRSMLRREPYRLFFPLGIALAWAGVGHWLLYVFGFLSQLHPVFHAMTQIQGFLTCFAVGFLLTMIPRRTSSDPPSTALLIVAAIAPIGITVSAWLERWAISQVFWLILMIAMLGFIVPRLTRLRGKRRPPNSFVWIPTALLIGIAGSVLTGVGAAMGKEHWWLHDLGRRMVLQGVFISLVLGVGGLAIPLMTRGEPPPDGTTSPRDRLSRGLHFLAAIGMIASFGFEEAVSLRGGMFLRAAIITAVLLLSVDLSAPPKGPGLNRRLIWVSTWMLPLGYSMAAIFDQHYKAGLHVAFIGGFSLLAMAVSSQVSLGHAGLGAKLAKHPLPLIGLALAMLAAMGARVSMDFDADRYFIWMGIASGLFLAATLAWTLLVAKALFTAAESSSKSP